MKEAVKHSIIPEKNSDISHHDTSSINNLKELSLEQSFDIFGKDTKGMNEKKFSTDINYNSLMKKSELVIFTSSESKLCLRVLKAVLKGENSLFIPLPSYAQDIFLADNIAHYLDFSRSKSVVVDAQSLDAVGIVNEMTTKLGIKNSDNQFYEFARLMTSFFEQGHVLHVVIKNADNLTAQDYGYLYELATIIFEKFPKQKDKTLMKYIFIGDASIEKILRRKVIGQLKKIEMNSMTVTDCVNALYLHTPQSERSELFQQTVAHDAHSLWVASCGYPALLRQLLPMPPAPSLADRQQPENYLCKLIDNNIDIKHHSSLAYKRMMMKKNHEIFDNRLGIKIVLSVFIVALFAFCFYLFFFV